MAEAGTVPGSQPEGLDVLLARVIGSLGAQRKLAECRAMLAWPDAVGPVLARHTHALRVAHGRLEVAVPTSVWRNQLSLMQRDLVSRLNRIAGAEVISNLVLVNREYQQPGAGSQPSFRDKE